MVIQGVANSPPQSPTMSKDVLYIGSAVPLETSEGLDAIQQPLRSRYPVHDEESIQGILSTLTITSNGIQLRYKTDPSHVVFFPFSSLSLCAAVRCVKTTNAATNEVTSRFVSLSQAAADGVNADRPAIFTTITRRTKGRQVLECHGFITVTPKDAMDLVQWTSNYDKKYKQSGGAQGSFSHMNGTSTMGLNTTHDVSRADMSFRGETASLPEFPVNLVAGEPMVHTAAQGFYNEAPKEGYFYSTKRAQVKKFSLHKFGKGEDEGIDHMESPRPGYAGSHYSLPVTHHPPMMVPGPMPVPLRPMPMGRPVLIPGPHPHPVPLAHPPPPHMMFARPRFFSPPPPPTLMRAQPVPVFLTHPPPPGVAMYNGVPPRSSSKPKGRGSRHSSSSSSSSSSSDRDKKGGKKHNGRPDPHLHEDSSVISSRPLTPPTDYDSAPPRMGRISRKDEYNIRQSYLRELNGPNRGAMTLLSPGRKPQGYYVVPVNNAYGAPTLPRTRSVPPPADKSSKKDKKSKKKKKSKKNKDKSKKSGVVSDGRNIEVQEEIPDVAMRFRDYHTMENTPGYERSFSRSAAERAFSKSLIAETTRNSGHGESFNAYRINQNGVPEGEFPTMY